MNNCPPEYDTGIINDGIYDGRKVTYHLNVGDSGSNSTYQFLLLSIPSFGSGIGGRGKS